MNTEKATPGLTDATRFWQVIERGDIEAANQYFNQCISLSNPDLETRQIGPDVLTSLKKDAAEKSQSILRPHTHRNKEDLAEKTKKEVSKM